MIEANDQRISGDSGHSENPLGNLLDPVFRPLTSFLAVTSENIPLELQPIPISSDLSPSNLFASLPPENSPLSLSENEPLLKSPEAVSTEVANFNFASLAEDTNWLGTSRITQLDSLGEVLVVPGTSAETVSIAVQWTFRDAKYNNEIGVFVVDQSGKVGGFAPGDQGFAQAALQSPTRQTLFNSGNSAGNWRELTFAGGSYLAFYLIQNDTSANWLANNASNTIGQQSLAFFSLQGANPDGFDHSQSTHLGQGIWRFNWEDLTGGGDQDFNDVVFNIGQPGILLPGEEGQEVPLTVDFVSKEATYQNEMGYFLVDTPDGKIGDLLPGDEGYTDAVLASDRHQVIIVAGEAVPTQTVNLPSTKYLGWYLIANGTTADIIQSRQNNTQTVPHIFFSYSAANKDGLSHLHAQADSHTWAWEDIFGGGDRDFNDLVFRFNLGDPIGEPTVLPNLSISDLTVTEGDTGTQDANFTVRLSQASSQTVTAQFTTEDDTAKSSEDYEAQTGIVSFAPGEVEKTISVKVSGDRLKESTESFKVNLANANNALISQGTGIGTIFDNDNLTPLLPSLSIGDVTVTEGDEGTQKTNFAVRLSQASEQTVTAEFVTEDDTAKSSEDYEAQTGMITFSPGEVEKMIAVNIKGDRLQESTESFKVNLANANNALISQGTGIGTIFDNDNLTPLLPSLSIGDVTVTEGDEGTQKTNFAVRLSQASEQTVTAEFVTEDDTAKSSEDYEAQTGMITFAPGEVEKMIAVNIKGDRRQELTENFKVKLTNVSNSLITKDTGIGTIIDNDPLPALSINDVPLTEGDDGTQNANFTVRLSQVSGQIVTVQFTTEDDTAKSGEDYQQQTGEITFAPGELEKTISVKVNGDRRQELTKSFNIKLTNANNALITQGTGIGTIFDNDNDVNEAPFFISQPILTAEVGTAYQYEIKAQDPDNNDILTISAIQNPLNWTKTDISNGVALLSQIPTINDIGQHIFEWKVEDADGLIATQNYTLAVSALLKEANNFSPSLQKAITVPTTPTILQFKIEGLSFDQTDINSIKDAFEVELVDAQGNSLVHTIGSDKTAFFNITEGLTANLAPGVTYDANTGIIRVNLVGVQPNATGNLVLRLVNNDQDTATQIRITDITLENAPAGTTAPVATPAISALQSVANPPNLTNLVDVSGSMEVQYQRTTLNEDTNLVYADFNLKNIGSYGVNTNLLVAIKNISDPTVQLRDTNGVTLEGLPYYDFTDLLINGKLDFNQVTNSRSLVFLNPNQVQFTYDVVVLAVVNRNPIIQTQPELEIIGGQAYQYDISSIDPDLDNLSYRLLVAPQGMTIDAVTGLINWQTTTTNIGNQVINVEVTDGRGGLDQQSYTLSITGDLPNRPPTITSTPIVDGRVKGAYLYDVEATDPDSDTLIYELIQSPTNMAIESDTGVIHWLPTASQLGLQDVTVKVNDGKGGTVEQKYQILVQQEVGNIPPVIITDPVTKIYPSSTSSNLQWNYSYDVDAVDADKDNLTYSLIDKPTGMTINPDSGLITWNAVAQASQFNVKVKVEDGRGGFDIQSFVLELADRNIDLTLADIHTEKLVIDGQLLTVSGQVSAQIKNQGLNDLTDHFKVVFFEDRNINQSYDVGIDTVLGETQVNTPLQAGQTTTVTTNLSGFLSFVNSPIWGFVDADKVITETTENNNLAFSSQDCIFEPSGEFNPVVEWNKNIFSVLPSSNQVMMTPAVIDVNSDQIPDVIFSTFTGGNYTTDGVLRVISGANGSEIWTIEDPAYRVRGSAGVAVGDIDNDGKPEILATAESGDALIAFEHDGTFKWRSPSVWGGIGWGSASIADLNQDGTPEIIIGATALDNQGKILWQGNSVGGLGRGDNGVGPLSVVADLDLDGSPEVVAGKSAYRADGSLYWNASINDGFSAIGNFDSDPNPEIVVISSGQIYLLEHTGEIKWGGVNVPGGGNTGAPTIADVDGDGQAEIGVAGANQYVVFETDGSIKWTSITQDNSSNVTGSSVFDFDGDGKAEIVYGDELYLRIYNGSDGQILYQLPKGSGTTYEMPLVVDVDADGNAEIVAIANNYAFGSQTGIFVIGDLNDTWVSTRQIWNQHSYHITNINDDGSIPIKEANSWQNHNTYRLNLQTNYSPLAAPDLTASYLRTEEASGKTTIKARIGNGGSIFVASGVNVAFYKGDPKAGGVLLGTTKTTQKLEIGGFEDVSLTVNEASLQNIWVVADDDGTGKGQVNECNEENNRYSEVFVNGRGEIRGTKWEDINGDGIRDNFSTSKVPNPIKLTQISTPFNQSIGIDYHEPTNSLIISANYFNGNPNNFERILLDGTHASFSNISGLTDEVKIATVKSGGIGGFKVGDLFVGNGVDGQIVKITDNGSTVINPWIDLPGDNNGLMRGSLYIDRTGVFNGDLIAVTTTGQVWQINSQGGSKLLASLGTHLEGLLVVPNDVNKYGPLAGKIIAGAEDQTRLYSIDPQGKTAFYDVGVKIEDIDFISPNENFFGVNYGTSKILGAPASQFSWMIGDILLTQESHSGTGLFRLFWNGTTLNTEEINLTFDSQIPGQWEHVTFAPVGLDNIPQVEPGLTGVQVYLDLNNNGLLDANEPSQITSSDNPNTLDIDETGQYRFTNLTPGSYVVREVVPGGYKQTAPINSQFQSINFDSLLPNTILTDQFKNLGVTFSLLNSPSLTGPVPISLDALSSPYIYPPASGIAISPGSGLFASNFYDVEMSFASPIDYFSILSLDSDEPISALGYYKGNLVQKVSFPSGSGQQVYKLELGSVKGTQLFDKIILDVDDGGPEIFDNLTFNAVDLNFYTIQLKAGEIIKNIDFGNTKINQTIPNQSPAFISIFPTTAQADQLFRHNAKAIDPDGDRLTYSLSLKPEGMTIDENTGLIAWKPTAEQLGTHEVILRVQDNLGGVTLQSAQILVQPTNHAPLFTSIVPDNAQVQSGKNFQFQSSAIDPDNDSLTYSLASTTGNGITINATTGLVTWTPDDTQLGTRQFTILAADGKGGQAFQTVTLTVNAATNNQAPIFTSTPRTTTRIDSSYFYQVEATDPNGDALTYSLVNAPTGMTLENGLISWQSTAAQAGQQTVTIQASDGTLTTEQTYQITVSHQASNRAPVITSAPNLTTNIEQIYTYNLTGQDPDSDLVFWSLDQAPSGMVLDIQTGVLRWQPQSNQLGQQQVIVRLLDSYGDYSTQSFTLAVNGTNTPVNVLSNPITRVAVGQVYTYDVAAVDPENSSLTYSLGRRPDGMTIDATGKVQWTPTQVGSYDIDVSVTDNQGATTTQTYRLEVGSTAINYAPNITSTPGFVANVGGVYQYQVEASDPDGQTLRYQLLESPQGMTIDAANGLLTWTTPVNGNYQVVLAVFDSEGLGVTQGYTLTAKTNSLPVIRSTPGLEAVPNQTYRYDLQAVDPDGDSLRYSLDATSQALGMTLDTQGRLTWTPNNSQLGDHAVTLTAIDGAGGATQQTFTLKVTADTTAPQVRINRSLSLINQGDTVSFQVVATDNVGIANLQLLINDMPVVIDSNGVASFTATTTGVITAKAVAIDAAGNRGEATTTVNVIDPTDTEAPTVSLDLSGIVNGEITAPVEIKGSVNDTNLAYYVLEVAPADGSQPFKEMFRGTSTVENGVLGILDPTLLPNDTYKVRLVAYDVNGAGNGISELLDVKGDLKLGNFQLSFTDLEIPVSGIPITLTRTYDTLTSNSQDDFGYGWRMEFRNAQVRTSLPKDELYEELGFRSVGFKEGDSVYITLPGGKRERFTFKLESMKVMGIPLTAFMRNRALYIPTFVADQGSTSTLTVNTAGIVLIKGIDGQVVPFSGGSAFAHYNTQDWGNYYQLTTKEGVVYNIDATTGDINTITNRNGDVLSFSDGGIVSSNGQQVTFERDAQGRIVAAIDPMGNRVSYQYDANGDLVKVTDRENNTTTFEYNGQQAHYLDKIIDPLGKTGVRNEYDENGRLTKVFNALGNSVQLEYNPDNSLYTTKDALGNATTYEYDLRGNVITEVDAKGGITRRTYDEDNNQLSETNPEGETNSSTYDSSGNKLTETDALGNVTRYTYNAKGDLLSTTDALGNTVTNTYDSNGNPTAISGLANGPINLTYGTGGLLTTLTTAEGTTTYEYDGQGNVTKEVDPLGHETTYTYDGNGNRLTETRKLTTSAGVKTLVTTTEYNAKGDVIKVTDALGNVTQMAYDANGQKTQEVDALGRVTKYVYSDGGQLLETIYADATPNDDSDNPRTRKEYDAANRVIAEIDELGRRTEFQYDALGRLTFTLFPDLTPNDASDNPRTESRYDDAGRVIAEVDERGNITRYEYDGLGRRTKTILPDGTPNNDSDNPQMVVTYDALGRQLTQTDPLGRTTQYLYDSLGRSIGQIFADQTDISTTYDLAGRVVAKTDQMGNKTQYEYNAAGQLTAVIDALNQRTEYQYNELGNLISQKDALGNTTRYEYDGLGRRIGTDLPLGQEATMTYDAVGNLLTTTDFNGETIHFEYDERNRLLSRIFPDNSRVAYTYTLTGQRATETSSLGTITYSYDVRDNLLSRVDADGVKIEYSYDAANNRTAVKVPSGQTSYSFDEQNRLKTVTDPQAGVTTYTYDLAGNLIKTTLANGTTETREYDLLNRLLYLQNSNGNEVINSFRYTLDKVGNRLAIVEQDGRQSNYQYDALYRLLQEEIIDGTTRTISYTYDAVSNRLTRNDSLEGNTGYEYDGNDRLLKEVTNGVTTTYTYDNNGNTLTKTVGTAKTTYEWNVENRLVGADTDGDGVNDVTNEYDGDGVRIRQTVAGEETRFLVDKNRDYAQVLEEYTPSKIIKASYIYGHDLISQLRNTERSFYHVDGLGSTRALTDINGLLTDAYAYEAFGEIIKQLGNTQNSYLFAGEQRDPNLSLDYLRARYLDINSGRFIRKDTYEGRINEPQTLNQYVYAHANPANIIDPTGLFGLGDISAAYTIRDILANIQIDFGFNLLSAAMGGDTDSGLSAGLAVLFPIVGSTTQKLPGLLGGAAKQEKLNKIWGNTSSRALRASMIAAGIKDPGWSAAHHIVAGSAKGAKIARTRLAQLGIPASHPANGVFLNQYYHERLHSPVYYKEVNRRILAANKNTVISVLKQIGKEIQEGKFPF